MAKRAFISVGHGGDDPGAVANGFKEKDINLVIALSCRDELVRHGVEVLMSRETDVRVLDAVKRCNAFKPDRAIDIHINAGGGDGVEIFYHYLGGASKTLAQLVIDSIVKETGQNSRGVKAKRNSQGKDYYAFIRETAAPAIIVECAFIDNKKDIAIVDTAAEQKLMGVAIAKGVLKDLGIPYKAPVKVEQAPTAKPEVKEEPKTEAPAKKPTPAPAPAPVAPAAKPATKPAPKAGDAVKLNKGKLYTTARGSVAVTRTGTFYLYDGVAVNGRYRVTNAKNRVGKTPIVLNVSGWVKM